MTTPEKKTGHGCFFYGCLVSIILVVLATLGIYFGVKWWVNQQVIRFTETHPMDLPRLEYTPEEAQSVRQRVEAFAQAVKEGRPAPALILNERELNLLLAGDPDLKPISQHVYLSIQSNQLHGAISLPLEKVPVPLLQKFKGRYFNGAVGLQVSLTNGFFRVTLQSLELKGKPVPAEVLAQLRQQNLAKEFYKNEEGMRTIQKLKSITVDHGRLRIEPRVSP